MSCGAFGVPLLLAAFINFRLRTAREPAVDLLDEGFPVLVALLVVLDLLKLIDCKVTQALD